MVTLRLSLWTEVQGANNAELTSCQPAVYTKHAVDPRALYRAETQGKLGRRESRDRKQVEMPDSEASYELLLSG